MEDRLVELESRYMHQEQIISDMSDIVYRQEQAISRLEMDIRQLREEFNLSLPSITRTSEEESPPPHY